MRECESSRRFSAASGFLIALLVCAGSAQASGAPIPHGTVELISENQSIAIGHPFYLGLHFQLEKGWHIYWVNPGDSGEPPRVTWQLPTGLSAGVIEWPAPRRIGTSSVVDFGYQDAVTLIVPVHAETSLVAQPLARLGAEIKVLVCREMCIPGRTQLSLTLPIKSRPSAPDVRTANCSPPRVKTCRGLRRRIGNSALMTQKTLLYSSRTSLPKSHRQSFFHFPRPRLTIQRHRSCSRSPMDFG